MPSLKLPPVHDRFTIETQDWHRDGLCDIDDFAEPDLFMKNPLGGEAQEFVLKQISPITDELMQAFEVRAAQSEHQLSLGEAKEVANAYYRKRDRENLKREIRGPSPINTATV